MKNISKYIVIALAGISFTACKDYLEPKPDNNLTQEELLKIPAYTEGLLLNAYKDMPANVTFNEDVISDDAVSNDPSSTYRQMATGSWNAGNNPISKWNQAYKEIYYINSFMEVYKKVVWDDKNPEVNKYHLKRLTGEAYGLRAWWQFQLLKYYAGEATDGQLLGFPIVLKPLSTEDNFNLPRNTFEECVNRIVTDCDSAIANLPNTFADVSGNTNYNLAMGARWTNRMPGYAARALKATVLLYAASPAYNPTGDMNKWANAAKAAGELLKLNGGLPATMPAAGLNWYTSTTGVNAEIIWSRAIVSNHNLETDNFPPSQLGNGRTNPTQELVNAFPMKNGYPITNTLSLYNQANPYANRDPRLATYILYNGNTLGAKGAISTYIGAPKDGINVQTNSTRTGYYLKKFVLDNVSLGSTITNQNHFNTYFRFTEVYLAYAEAANEAYGPDADPNGFGFTARAVIAGIRKRAGITQPDAYLATITSKATFRDLIRNERRLELCFEGQRFFDVRRWKDLTDFKAPVSGAFITKTGSAYTYDYQQVEERKYEDYMIYSPLPKNELLKSDQLKQNKNWQ
ncbi:RagB/SusD family nutrient uptake outer membrane protein (plasmid) [Pedobacter sp. BS3]|uniref:RagB/SusD family nutrient uptake outer membrane protein n=1 Tax=Pedobacter sp. BS3 TaxID=2567937 RepID=UPI0011F02318|nr:RagB/SusD family nutrient uptake outer membrane protein [Pedobacter sp. BS3]TZF85513.1 RagB/SusD family nutrient uptake outer membrane protein [Pedobacter sp. BS3]